MENTEDAAELDLQTLERIASSRRTIKVIAERDLPGCDNRKLITRLLACSGWAPFHRMCNAEHRIQGQPTGVEPWRFFILDAEQCRRLRRNVQAMEAAGKIPGMLGSADAAVIATWLPNPPLNGMQSTDPEFFEPTLDNVEHIAAASAAVQSLLLAATAAGVDNYWSSGGVLRDPFVLKTLEIPSNQRVLGAIFLFPGSIPESEPVQVVGSKLRSARGGPDAWSRWVQIEDETK